jgi:3-oxoacyl-[acyl-carrier-protein] synthase-3
MAVFTVPNIKISGLAASVPKQVEDNLAFDLLPEKERELFVNTTGIRYRRIAPAGITAADLCQTAAEKLLEELKWNREEINILIFISQTPDYLIPNSSSVLQHKLGLSKSCLCFDINLGCSGYVYGLSVVASLLQNMPKGKALLLVGDVSSACISKTDKSTAPLFSDAGSATALEYSAGEKITFNLQTDGKEYDDIIIYDGGYRNPFTAESLLMQEIDKGITRNKVQMKLDGVKILNFALREVAPNIKQLATDGNIDIEAVDYFIFHQANKLMLESVRKKIPASAEKVPYSLYDYGNTSSASIPITMTANLHQQLASGELKLLLSGFGVGLSWGSAYIVTRNIVCLPLIEV